MSGIDIFESIIGEGALRLAFELKRSPARHRSGAVLKMDARYSAIVYEVEADASFFLHDDGLDAPGFAAHAWTPMGTDDIHAQFVRWAEANQKCTTLLTTHVPTVLNTWWGEDQRGTGGWTRENLLVARRTLMQMFRLTEKDPAQRVKYRVRYGWHALHLPFDGTEPTIVLERARLVGARLHGITLREAARLEDTLLMLRDLVRRHGFDQMVFRAPVAVASAA